MYWTWHFLTSNCALFVLFLVQCLSKDVFRCQSEVCPACCSWHVSAPPLPAVAWHLGLSAGPSGLIYGFCWLKTTSFDEWQRSTVTIWVISWKNEVHMRDDTWNKSRSRAFRGKWYLSKARPLLFQRPNFESPSFLLPSPVSRHCSKLSPFFQQDNGTSDISTCFRCKSS